MTKQMKLGLLCVVIAILTWTGWEIYSKRDRFRGSFKMLSNLFMRESDMPANVKVYRCGLANSKLILSTNRVGDSLIVSRCGDSSTIRLKLHSIPTTLPLIHSQSTFAFDESWFGGIQSPRGDRNIELLLSDIDTIAKSLSCAIVGKLEGVAQPDGAVAFSRAKELQLSFNNRDMAHAIRFDRFGKRASGSVMRSEGWLEIRYKIDE
jgi:hypothetical protein